MFFSTPFLLWLATTVGSTHLRCSFASRSPPTGARAGHVAAPRHHAREGRGQPCRRAQARDGHASEGGGRPRRCTGVREGRGDEGQAHRSMIARESHRRASGERKKTKKERKGEFYWPTGWPYLIKGREFLQSAWTTLPYNLQICFHNLL